MIRIDHIARFSLTSGDPARLARFYEQALGFAEQAVLQVDAAAYGVAGRATVHRLRLGRQEIELVGFAEAGRPYPADSTSHDAWFQHLALVTTDMEAAHARLAAGDGWSAITGGGRPVVLPPSSGGVAAFKFRDPEGHPLELLAFPPGQAPSPWAEPAGPGPIVGIDHSAIAVRDTDQSIAFYAELGFVVSARSLNQGPAQETLDAAPGVRVAVTGLAPTEAPPHLELLGYHAPAIRPGPVGPADIACTRTVLRAQDAAEPGRMLLDPDGHRLLIAGS